MKVGEKTLEAFRAWLEEWNLSSGTVDVYMRDTNSAAEHAGSAAGTLEGMRRGFLKRLRDDELAPKTRHHTLAAANHWSEFTDDKALRDHLKRLILPPARRKQAKVPITREQLLDLVDELAKTQSYMPQAMRGVLGVMACRGLRCGDVLRLKRREVLAAKENGTLSFEAKGKRRLEFKVTKNWRKYLDLLVQQDGAWSRVEDLVVTSGKQTARRRSASKSVERMLTKVGVKLGIRGIHPHQLRRTYAVQYLRALKGDPEGLVKLTQHMCWASMQTAMEYVDHARGDELDSVAEGMFDR